jgi:nucleoside-diphosphate-sugar epimerase
MGLTESHWSWANDDRCGEFMTVLESTSPISGFAMLVERGEPILITGSNGFIGARVVKSLLHLGFSNLLCFVRPSSDLTVLNAILSAAPGKARLIQGNLLSRDDCDLAAKDVALIYHLAAGIEKSFSEAFKNSVTATGNLLDAAVASGRLRRFVNVSSFSVYSNWNLDREMIFDEECEIESHPIERAEAYAFAKLKQDELVVQYGKTAGIPYVILRPGAVFGPGAQQLTARIGINILGIFLHLGGSNRIPFTYVDNCADAIALAGLTPGIDGEVFNVVDDDLPSSRQFLKMFKRRGKHLRSIYVPYWLFYSLCWAWEGCSKLSSGKIPPTFNRRRCSTYWKGNRYSNRKLKDRLGWMPAVSFSEASRRYFDFVRNNSL